MTYQSHGVRGEYFVSVQHGEVGDVGEEVDEGDDGKGNDDGAWERSEGEGIGRGDVVSL